MKRCGIYIWVSLIFSFFLLIGCGGGSVDNIPIKNNPQSNVTLSGYVVEGSQNSIKTSSELRYSLGNNLSGINVFLEKNNTLRGITDNSGKFIIENVPEGYNSIIAEKKEAGAIIYRQRLKNINIKGIDNYYELPEPISILPSPYLLTLLITNTKNHPINNAKIFLWGRDYFSDSDGLVRLTDFPNLSDEEATISASGYKTTKIKLSFGESINSKIFVKLSQTSDNNSAPTVEIKHDSNSSIIKENNKLYISANKQLLLTALGNDPDGNSNKITWNWSADKGSFSGLTTAKEVTFSSPSISGEVTITLIGKDEKGLESKAELKLIVIGGSKTDTSTDTQTNTETNTSTNTDTSTSTNTQTQTDTNTSTSTSSNTETQTSTSTNTETNTSTNTQSTTNTETNTQTNTQTQTWTNTQTLTYTVTSTGTSTGVVSSGPYNYSYHTTSNRIIGIYGGTLNNPVYLGELNSNNYKSDSIWNSYGTYGSKYNSYSIWNKYGNYGGQYSNYSPFNNYTTTPPMLFDSDYNFYGYLTSNQYMSNRTHLYIANIIINNMENGYNNLSGVYNLVKQYIAYSY